MPLLDRLTFGPARRRRRLERQWRELQGEFPEHFGGQVQGLADRSLSSYDAWPPPPPVSRPASLPVSLPASLPVSLPRRRRTPDAERRRTVLVVLLTSGLLATSLALIQPTLLPGPVAEALGLTREPLGRPPDVGGPGTYEFIALQRDGRTPVAYDPCRPIPVTYNPLGAPDEGVELVQEAMAVVGAATGLRFEWAGETDERPRWSDRSPQGLGRTDPVLVAFSDANEVPALAGRVAGIGGSVQISQQGRLSRFVTGQVTLDSAAFGNILRRRGGYDEARAIVLHEFGHLVGLDHVDDPGELMNAENLGLRDFGNGDRIGLAALGRGACF